jgi:hypothetical protein
MDISLKTCSDCKVEKELCNFSYQKSTGYYNSVCKKCQNIRSSKKKKGKEKAIYGIREEKIPQT